MDFRGRDLSVGATAFAEDLEQVGERVDPSVRNTIPEGGANAGMEGCNLRLLGTRGECAEELRLLHRRAKAEDSVAPAPQNSTVREQVVTSVCRVREW